MSKEYRYSLPEEEYEIVTESQSLIIIGANGVGKSRLGAWIEKKIRKIRIELLLSGL